MEAFDTSYNDVASYPCNLVSSDVPALLLDGKRQELQQEAPRLFCDEGSASIDFIEIQTPGEEHTFRPVRGDDDLQKILGSAMVHRRHDPSLRMIFLYGRSQMDRLYVTKQMAQRLLSYHQIMPAFLDNLFMFGYREDTEDCAATSFQSHNRISSIQRGLEVPELGRSGRAIEHCYGLRSVERSGSEEHWPWSVRTCSIYHSLDIESGQATWLVLKANRLIEKLVRDDMRSKTSHDAEKTEAFGAAFIKALRIHELVALWAGEKWPLYISFLESRLQEITRPALSVTMDQRSKTISADQLREPSTVISPDEKTIHRKQSGFSVQTVSERIQSFGKKASPPQESRKIEIKQHEFSFSNLPSLHYIEEKASEAHNVLSTNIEILEDLKSSYSDVIAELDMDMESDEFVAFNRFAKEIARMQKSLRTQQARIVQLAKLSKDRRALISRILDYESMSANRILAEKAGTTAENMEQLAVKTKLETVSMRIITLVTLFFLPGTFISTLMSTPIVKFAPGSPSIGDSNVSTGALGFYCAVSVPLVIITFAAWYFVYWWESRKEKKRQDWIRSQSAASSV